MIGIVGGGLTGLALAYELEKRGIDHTVLEAADRPGGVIRSARIEGRVLDFGPQRGRMTPRVADLIAALRIEREVVYASDGLPLFVYADGALREAAFSVEGLLRGGLLSWRGKLRLLAEPLTASPRTEEDVATLFRRKLGREAYERLAGPLYGGLYGSDPADMLVGLSLAPLLRELGVGRSFLLSLVRRRASAAPAAAFSFREGMQRLPEALHARCRENVRLGSRVLGLMRRSGGWVLEMEKGTLDAETVVLTCDSGAAALLLERIDPESAARLRRLACNDLAVVPLFAPDARLRGLGYQVALSENLATRGVTWNDSLFGGREGVFTAFLGGATQRAALDEPDDRVGEIAVREFRRVTGHDAEVLAVARTVMPAWDVSWRALEGFQPPQGIRVAANWRRRPGIPGRLAEAAALADELARGYVSSMEGTGA
jgi:oxygen-dependent protoporphyrinogen oxidase